ncbi:MAG: ribonuclease HI family protein [Candidatus Levyibacteriota bacterium]|nr:MAG: ribonuclease HI family protein [Candidatus Levybacteria bacterium]
MIYVYTDGGARGNPGPAAIGVFICDENGKQIHGFGKTIGETTNNIAEYTAVNEALEWLLNNKHILKSHAKIHFFLDSLLLVSQINRIYKIKNPKLQELLFSVREKESQLLCPVSYTHIPREKNKKADALVNLALDNKLQ